MPVLIHTGDYRYDFSNPNRMVPILETYDKLTVIGAHLGGWSIWEDAVKEYKDFPNFYVDCSSSFNYITPEVATKVIKTYGADKVLFGTDYPMWEAEEELKFLLSLPLDESEIKCILNMNAKKLFNLE